ncbi:MAG: ATPase [Microgenomates group bacterium GW2011_GWA1_Microgenomates_45_10]|nr:MAG: ATPase [Microgenomates group bacterium GW2011_GWB1_44_8]KKT87375.1 MAG: ATPase [Microgenomates group bacterium GW2011_GWA1_Microgenomates_45_10]
MVHTFPMTGKDLLKTIITDSQQRVIPEVWERTLKIPTDSGKIITLSGVRRSGKTYHLFSLMNQLKASGVPNEQLLYFNFDDERLQLSSRELDSILQAYQELYPTQKLSDCYFFFDEIQEVDGWEKFISRIYASINQHVFITGSNAKLLSKEIATGLRGRTITFEVYPLSFAEYVGVLSPKLNPHSSTDKATLINLFDRFMHQGGFPELVHQEDELKDKVLQEYFNVMVLRDLIERYQISNSSTLKYFCKRVVGASGGEFSVNKVYNELKSQGYQVGKDTLYLYQNYVEAIYLNRFINKYSHSVVKAESSQKKCYVIDQGMGAALDYKLSQERGRLLETTVALELLKQGRQIAYQQNGSECDFVVIEKGRVTIAIQVAADFVDVKTKEREIKGLIQACQKFGLSEGIILTFDHTEQLEQEGVRITAVPAWQFFFGRSN